MTSRTLSASALRVALASALVAAPFAGASADTYRIDPSHTYPSFAANHMGISWFRGKFNKTAGTIELDRQAKTGRIEIIIDAASIDMGHAQLNKHLLSADLFDVEKHPEIRFTGSDFRFEGDVPVAVGGELRMLGVSKPVELKLESFACRDHPMLKVEVCGAEATAVIDRSDWGLSYGAPPSTPEVRLAIQVEALKQ